jgi:hypothetical protein
VVEMRRLNDDRHERKADLVPARLGYMLADVLKVPILELADAALAHR